MKHSSIIHFQFAQRWKFSILVGIYTNVTASKGVAHGITREVMTPFSQILYNTPHSRSDPLGLDDQMLAKQLFGVRQEHGSHPQLLCASTLKFVFRCPTIYNIWQQFGKRIESIILHWNIKNKKILLNKQLAAISCTSQIKIKKEKKKNQHMHNKIFFK